MIASKNIVIVSEAEPKSKEFELAIERIKVAQRIYFLGFGYYRVNLERLGLSQLGYIDESDAGSRVTSYGIQFRGSALGFGNAQMKAIQYEWRIKLFDNNSDALQFLKEYADLS